MDRFEPRRTTAIVVLCACIASALAGVLITRPGSDGFPEGQPIVVPRTQIATPVATPVDLPPFFGVDRDGNGVASLPAAER